MDDEANDDGGCKDNGSTARTCKKQKRAKIEIFFRGETNFKGKKKKKERYERHCSWILERHGCKYQLQTGSQSPQDVQGPG